MNTDSTEKGPIGVFDSGYGGLTILKALRETLPDYDYMYLGDNARAPYGSRSFDLIYEYTLSAVKYLFAEGCRLVILACNTASAKALRTIQQRYLPAFYPQRRVLGVIRPTVEILGNISTDGHVGVLGTIGTVASRSYTMEIAKLYPEIKVSEQACPLFVPIIENGEADSEGADYFVRKYLDELFRQDPDIDTVLLACTHYPLLLPKIKKQIPSGVRIISQGTLVAESLVDYLQRHPEIRSECRQNGKCDFATTENADKFNSLASLFLGYDVNATKINL